MHSIRFPQGNIAHYTSPCEVWATVPFDRNLMAVTVELQERIRQDGKWVHFTCPAIKVHQIL